MVLIGLLALVLVASARCVAAVLLRDDKKHLAGYSFAGFAKDFDRKYVQGSDEYENRAALFHASLAEIKTLNSQEGRSWKAGVHKFMDWTQAERATLLGYKPERGAPALALLQAGSVEASNVSSYGKSGGMSATEGPAVRDQGNCGSCWAISAVEAVEARLGAGVRLSAQALVDCVPNPQHCGGNGGCDGATGELAYAFMREHGIPMEGDLPYIAETKSCPLKLEESVDAVKRVVVNGWNRLLSNSVAPLMQALVQTGPVVVAAAADQWFNYDSGIFDDCPKDVVLNHAILAKGFAEDNGRKYWLIQNSWGTDWGENGHIRLQRHDTEGEWCGVDNKPEEGLGCVGGPKEITVCGMCGVLYDPVVPIGAALRVGDAGRTKAAVAKGASKPGRGRLRSMARMFSVSAASGRTDTDIVRAIFDGGR